MYESQRLTERIIGLAIDVHRATGPGLLESAYKACLCWELDRACIAFEREAPLPILYRGNVIRLGFRADIVVMDTVILEIKAVPVMLPAHEAQMLTYLRMTHIRVGLLLNFHAPRLVDGLKRFVV
jgi:GxxExxY protein